MSWCGTPSMLIRIDSREEIPDAFRLPLSLVSLLACTPSRDNITTFRTRLVFPSLARASHEMSVGIAPLVVFLAGELSKLPGAGGWELGTRDSRTTWQSKSWPQCWPPSVGFSMHHVVTPMYLVTPHEMSGMVVSPIWYHATAISKATGN